MECCTKFNSMFMDKLRPGSLLGSFQLGGDGNHASHRQCNLPCTWSHSDEEGERGSL